VEFFIPLGAAVQPEINSNTPIASSEQAAMPDRSVLLTSRLTLGLAVKFPILRAGERWPVCRLRADAYAPGKIGDEGPQPGQILRSASVFSIEQSLDQCRTHDRASWPIARWRCAARPGDHRGTRPLVLGSRLTPGQGG
jgi:hypothetical protein